MLNKGIKSAYVCILLSFMVICCFTSCKTSRNMIPAFKKDKVANGYLSSKLELTIPTGNSVYTVNGNLKMAKGEMIRVSFLMPFLGTEVGRVEATPDYLMLVDRMGKRFTRISWKGVARMTHRRIDFRWVEKLLKGAALVKKNEVVLRGEQIGISPSKHLELRLYHFSDEPFEMQPTELSNKYKEVQPEVLLEFLKSL